VDLPLDGAYLAMPFEVVGQPSISTSNRPYSHYQTVTSAWFKALGIPLIAGREFVAGDRAESLPVCIVSEELVRQYFAGQDPLGQRLRVAPLTGKVPGDVTREIIGVVRQVKVNGLGERAAAMEIYVPYTQDSWAPPMIAIAINGNPMAALKSELSVNVRRYDRESRTGGCVGYSAPAFR
jgi:putative ABC transport system permease protein